MQCQESERAQAQADAYAKEPIRLATTSAPPIYEGCENSHSSVPNVGFFCSYVQSWLENTQGISDTNLKTGGYTIVTTLDPALQASAQEHLSPHMPPTSPMTSVEPIVNPKNGDVLAMAASKAYGLNTSTTDNTHTEQPIFTSYVANGASTWKLFPLLTALATGVSPQFSLTTVGNTGSYTPHNCSTTAPVVNGDSNEVYSPTESMSTAMAKSSNTYFVGLADRVFGCDLTPILNMAERLGMKALDQPSGEGTATVAQAISDNQRVAQLALGSIPTSPLELTAAYAAVANNGVYNAPAPVLSITDSHGTSIPVKRTAGTEVVSPQVAMQATQIMQGETRGVGTSASEMQQYWYPHNGSNVAGKTGTVTAGAKLDQSGAVWFVGMTPSLVATNAIINFDSPGAPAVGLPGLANPSVDAYGGYAAGLWAQSLGPALQNSSWSWPSPDNAPGIPVPSVVGLDLINAKAKLESVGFKMALLDSTNNLQCSSAEPVGSVAYAGPSIAPAGSTITVCPSNGVSLVTNPAGPTGGNNTTTGNSPPSQPDSGPRTPPSHTHTRHH